jgi:hypothetical protein
LEIKSHILKGAGVLLIAAIMVLSAAAATANTTNEQKITPACLETGAARVEHSGEGTIGSYLVWDNGYPNEVNGLCCQRVGAVPLCDTADDFHTDQEWLITGAEWDTIDDTTYAWDGTDDMIIYEFTPTGPGAIVQEIWNVPNTRVQMGELFGRPWWRYTIDLVAEGLDFALPAGDYFILLRPYTPGTSGQSFWATSDAPPESQTEVYFRSDYFGYPDWTEGHLVFGDYYDVSFRIYGEGEIPPEPDLDCEGDLTWEDVEPGSTVDGEFEVENVGDPTSELDWEIESWPEWGEWTFDPESGEDLTPEDGPVTVDVEVVAPDDPETEFEGEIVIVNSNNPDDTCTIEVRLVTPCNSAFMQFLQNLAERFPILNLIFGYLL